MSFDKLYRKMNESTLIAGATPDEYRSGGCTYDELVVLTSWLAERGDSAQTIAYAVEKPWKYADELSLALSVQRHEVEHSTGPVHQCQERGDGTWYCAPEWVDGVEQSCDWEWTAS